METSGAQGRRRQLGEGGVAVSECLEGVHDVRHLEDRLHGQGPQAGEGALRSAVPAAEGGGHLGGDVLHLAAGPPDVPGVSRDARPHRTGRHVHHGLTARHHGTVEQAPGSGRRQVSRHGGRAERHTGHGDVAGITAESARVVPYPGEGGSLVLEAEGAGPAKTRQGQASEDPEAVVDGDDHQAPLGQAASVEEGAPAHRTVSVNPYEHGRGLPPGRDRRRRDVQDQAVLLRAGDARVGGGHLGAERPRLPGVPDPLPRLDRAGRRPPVASLGGRPA